VEYGDGHWHDRGMAERCRMAVLQISQDRRQSQVSAQTRRRQTLQALFRVQLEELLGGSPYYEHLDDATREHLIQDVPRLAFPDWGLELS
jgi:hypothetical protein